MLQVEFEAGLRLSFLTQYLQDDEELNHPPTTKKLCISSPSD